MKFIASLLLTALLSYALCLFLPWWSVAIAAFIVALAIHQKGWKAFVAGLLAVFLLWVGLSFTISTANNDVMAHKVSVLFIKQDNVNLLFLLTGLLGGIVAAFGALTGSLARRVFTK